MEDLYQISKDAQRFASARGFSQHAEDFSQYVLECWLQGRTSSLRNLLVDYLRKYVANANNITRPIFVTDTDVSFLEKDPWLGLSIDKVFRKGDLRILLVLTSTWGFSQKELAYIFGVTEGRISQKLKTACDILRRKCGG